MKLGLLQKLLSLPTNLYLKRGNKFVSYTFVFQIWDRNFWLKGCSFENTFSFQVIFSFPNLASPDNQKAAEVNSLRYFPFMFSTLLYLDTD